MKRSPKKSAYWKFSSKTYVVGTQKNSLNETDRLIAISGPLMAQDKLFHRQNAMRNFLIPFT